MKNTILKTICTLALFIYSNLSTSQIIISRGGNDGVLPENYNRTGQYYYKDINNYLNNFTGTWEYNNGNEKFQIVLTKVIKYHVVIPNLNHNYYEDGIILRYKKYINNILVFQSPNYENPAFNSENGLLLTGYVRDFGRITKTLRHPLDPSIILRQGGIPLQTVCKIERMMTLITQPKKIKFILNPPDIPNYDYASYAGQPVFSIPNDIIMIKVN